MVTGGGYGRWLREMVTGSLCFPFFLDISPCGRCLRDVFVFLCGKLLLVKTCRRFHAGFPAVSLSEDCVPPRVGDGYGKWLREMVTGRLCFLYFWLREMVTGSLWEMVTGSLRFPFFLDISPCGRWYERCLCFPLREAAPGKNLS